MIPREQENINGTKYNQKNTNEKYICNLSANMEKQKSIVNIVMEETCVFMVDKTMHVANAINY